MSKRFDDFKNATNKMMYDLDHDKVDESTIKTAYLGMIAGYLATIIDQLNEMNNKEEE